MSAIAVLGAGPSGLLAALNAAEVGHDVVLLEASDGVGGMAASFEVGGQRVDYGSHRLHPATDSSSMQRIVDLLGDDLQRRERNGRIRLRDRWVGFPLRPLDMVRSLPLDFSARVAFDSVVGRRGTRDDSFAAAITTRLGATVSREFYEPYAEKLYGLPATQLHHELADRRVAATSPLHIIRRALRATRLDGRTFWYPKRGYGQISERLADAAVDAGVDVHLSTRVDAVVVDATTRSVRSGGREWACDVILSTLPQPVLASILEPEPPVAVQRSLAALRVRAMVLVYVVVPRRQYTPYDAHYFPETALGLSRLSEPKNYRDGPDSSSLTVLCAELPCWVDDETWVATDDELGARVGTDLERAGLPAPAATHVESRRLRSVYPVFEMDTVDDRVHAQEWFAGIDGLLSFGRQGLDVPDNLHHVLRMARDAVAVTAADGRIDRGRWAQALDRFGTHVIED